MKIKKIAFLFLSMMFLGCLTFVSGQPNGWQNRQRVRENLVTLRLLRLTQALDLSEEQAAKIYPVINRIEKEKSDIQKLMSADIAELRRLVNEQPPREADIDAKNRKIKAARESIRVKDVELDEFLEKNLTTVQKARYLLFQIEFYRVLNDSLDRMRMMRNKPLPAKKK
jgi:Spy/CpxP family protein refolding chaperone